MTILSNFICVSLFGVKLLLSLEKLSVSVGDVSILHNLSMAIGPEEIHVLLGSNGAGKSTLSSVIMGHPKYKITEGKILFKGKDVCRLGIDERSKAGIFVAFQNPMEVSGVSVRDMLKCAWDQRGIENDDLFEKELAVAADLLDLSNDFIIRDLNVGCSGGERKKIEILQMLMLNPDLVILDEIDSGLDVDAIKKVCGAINFSRKKNKKMSFLVITHHQRIFNHIEPDFVHVLVKGRIVKSGGSSLVQHVDNYGFQSL